MKNIVIIIPVYNDWKSLETLIEKIDEVLSNFKETAFSLLAVNDGSSIKAPNYKLPESLKKIEILNMRINQGHQICLANGINYAIKKYNFDYLILMDADGEDRPEEISDLLIKAKNLKDVSVVAKRVKRSEGPIFQIFYFFHKILTFIFTGKLMNFGNFSIITKKDSEIIIKDPTIISNYSGTLKNKIKKLGEINCIRGKRYFGPSNMPLFKLILHSFSIIAVFKMSVFIRSALFLVLLTYLQPYIGSISTLLQFLIVSFNVLIYLVSLKSNEKNLKNLDKELININSYTQ